MLLYNSETFIDYNRLIKKAMTGVIKDALNEVQKNNSKRRFCFIFEIDTCCKGVVLPKSVKKQYPISITLIIQHQYSNLEVFDDYFSVDLSFGGVATNVKIPYKSILVFSDKENEFEISLNDIFDDMNEFCFDSVDESEEDEEEENNTQNNLINFSDLKTKGNR